MPNEEPRRRALPCGVPTSTIIRVGLRRRSFDDSRGRGQAGLLIDQ
jgi:hypothetical protein